MFFNNIAPDKTPNTEPSIPKEWSDNPTSVLNFFLNSRPKV